MKNQTIQIRISEDLKNRLKEVSDKSGVPMSKIIVKALEHEINIEEYLFDEIHSNKNYIPDHTDMPYEPTDIDIIKEDIEVLKVKIDLILKAVKK